MRRILKPSGTFAAWTYSLPILNHCQHPAQVSTLCYMAHSPLLAMGMPVFLGLQVAQKQLSGM